MIAIALAVIMMPLTGVVTSSAEAAAGEPGVCDTNDGVGKIDSFMQNTSPDGTGDWANGNMNDQRADLAEGDVVPQRVEMSGLARGQNELVFTYDVWVDSQSGRKWAYDYIARYRMEGGQITRWLVENGEGPVATVRVTFDVLADVPRQGAEATLYYDLHIASELDHGAGSGAGSIPGSSYHGGLLEINCASSGQNANQIAANAVDAGELTIVKDADPADGTDFHFSITPGGGASTFWLDDDADATLPDRLTYRVAPGTYTIEETDLPDGWSIRDITCSKATSGSTPTSRTVSIADDEKVTCTFTNSRRQDADLTVTTTAVPSFSRDYDWRITKDVDGAAKKYDADGTASFDYDVVVTPSTPVDSDFRVSGEITVSNPNPVAVHGVSLSDQIGSHGCTVSMLGASAASTFSVPANGSVSFSYECDLPDATAQTQGTNTATVTWPAADYYGTTGSASGSAGFGFSAAKPTVTDGEVTVTDNRIDLADLPGGNVVTAPEGGRFDYSVVYDATEAGVCTPFTNTARITDDGTVRSDSATVEICKGLDLLVSKDREPSLVRTYEWDIVKSRNGEPAVNVDPVTGKASVEYSVVVSAGLGSDDTWLMTGSVAVENPNDWPVTLTDVDDSYPSMACDIVSSLDGEALVVPAHGSRQYDYRCTSDTRPSYEGTNTATATWDAARFGTPSGSASGTAAVAASDWDVEPINETVTVVDNGAGVGRPVDLGTFTWSDDFVSDPITYTLELPGERGECVPYRNIASVFGEGTDPLAQHNADVTVCWPTDLTVVTDATATYDTQYFWDIEKSVSPEDPRWVAAGEKADFEYLVTAVPAGSEDSGWDLSGQVRLTNPYDTAVEPTLAASYDNGTADSSDDVTCRITSPEGSAPLTLGAGESVTVGYDCAFASRPSYTGKVHVTVSHDGTSSKYAEDVVFAPSGKAVDRVVTVYDDKVDQSTPVALGQATWAWDVRTDEPVPTVFPGYTLSHAGVAGQCTDYTNTAWVDLTANNVDEELAALLAPGTVLEDPQAQATATVCTEGGLRISKTVEASYERSFAWLIDKTVADAPSAVTAEGATFDYTVTVTPNGSRTSAYTMGGTITVENLNTRAQGPITATVTDVPAVGGGATCTVGDGKPVTLDPGETRHLGYTCSFTGAPSDGANTATATWTGAGGAQRTASTGPVPVRFAAQDGDDTVTVTDDMTAEPVLGGATWNVENRPTVFRYSLTHRGVANGCVQRTNTATIVETGQSDKATVNFCKDGELSVTHAVEATLDRVYGWSIAKVADRSRLDTTGGQHGTVNYTVGVTPGDAHDSGWEVKGSLTVYNPNRHKDVTVGLSAVPALGEGASCGFASGVDLVVPAGKSRTFTYECRFSKKPAYDGSTTVVVTWDGGSIEDAADVDFEVDDETDRTVTITDDLLGPEPLGHVTWDESGETVELSYALELAGPVGSCKTVTNTATIVETGQKDAASVDVCGRVVTPPPVTPPPVTPPPVTPPPVTPPPVTPPPVTTPTPEPPVVTPEPPASPEPPTVTPTPKPTPQPPVVGPTAEPRPPIEVLPEPGARPRPPAETLPDAGAPMGIGLWTTLGGLMLVLGAALLTWRRRQLS